MIKNMFNILVCEYETGIFYPFNVDVNTTIAQLKQMFASNKEGVTVEELCAWEFFPLNNNDMTLKDYNIIYNGAVIFMAMEWTEYMSTLLQEMIFRVFVRDYETGMLCPFNVDANTTIGQLKQMFASIKYGTPLKANELCAWVKARMDNNDMTLADYNIAYDNIDIYMATDPLISYYT
jgi:hypothetical protein